MESSYDQGNGMHERTNHDDLYDADYYKEIENNSAFVLMIHDDIEGELRDQITDVVKGELVRINYLLPKQALLRLRGTKVFLCERAEILGSDSGFYQTSNNGLFSHSICIVDVNRMRRYPYWTAATLFHEIAHAFHARLPGGYEKRVHSFRVRASLSQVKAQRHPTTYMGRSLITTGYKDRKSSLQKCQRLSSACRDTTPFVRGELKKYDKDTYRLIRAIWHKPQLFKGGSS